MTLSQSEQKSAIEALIFASDEPLGIEDLFSILFSKDEFEKMRLQQDPSAKSLEIKKFIEIIKDNFNYTESTITGFIEQINDELIASKRAMYIVDFAGGYSFATRPEYGKLVAELYRPKKKKKLSPASVESLAIVAYRQPISKSGVEQIRGVNSSEVINSLLDKNLVKIVGRSESLGRALLYGTTTDFLKMFALSSISDLPTLKEIDEIAALQRNDESKQEVLIKVE
jgi:segregation and condensation protein B